MRQTTLCVPLEVKPESCSRLSALVEELRRQEDIGRFGFPENFARVARDIPTLHFMSMSVFTAADYDPVFILEANFDGAPGVFWGQLEAAFGDRLREMLRCCKKPLNEDGPLYEAVTAPDSRAPIAPYFEARTQRPSVFHHGNRGMTRDRILEEADLFCAVRKELDDPDSVGPNPYRGIGTAEVHRKLREWMLPAHPWLDAARPERIPKAERLQDLLRLLVFAVTVLLALSLPGLVLAPLLPRTGYVALMLGAAVVIGLLIYLKRKPLPGTGIETSFNLLAFLTRHAGMIIVGVLVYIVAATVLLIPTVVAASHLFEWLGAGRGLGLGEASRAVARTVLWGLLGLVVTVPLIILWLRHLERRDSSHDAPHVDERLLRAMVRREDWVAQNHMGSIVLIKPGLLRTIIIRAGHRGLGLLLRVKATDGYLGSMRTVHFAHWAFINNGSRLLFFSNFDHSWDSYLDDFIEKAHVGLTLAWGCGVGFPPTRFLIYDGASHGRRFKAWALASRAVSRFWYSAYPTLTVDQIERNNRVADGLRRPGMTEEEAATWMRDL
jgi:hypothetical protein